MLVDTREMDLHQLACVPAIFGTRGLAGATVQLGAAISTARRSPPFAFSNGVSLPKVTVLGSAPIVEASDKVSARLAS